MDKNYRTSLDNLKFSNEAKERITRALSEHANETQTRVQVKAKRGGKRGWHYAAAAVAAVVMAGALGGGAYASGTLMSMGAVFDDLFGGAPAQTEVVDKIGKPIGASVSSNGVTVTAEAVVGDKENYAIVYSIAKDDGTAFDLPEALEGGTLPLGFGGSSSTSIDTVHAAGGSAYFYDADPTDNAIQYVEKMSAMSGAGSVIGKTARAHFTDLTVYGNSEADERIVAEGTWNLKFAMNYEDTATSLPAGQTFALNGMSATIESLDVSPLAVTIVYTVDDVGQTTTSPNGKMSREDAAEMDRFWAPIFVTMADGTVIDASNGGGSQEIRGDATLCHKGVIFDEFVNVDDIVSIAVGDVVVTMP